MAYRIPVTKKEVTKAKDMRGTIAKDWNMQKKSSIPTWTM